MAVVEYTPHLTFVALLLILVMLGFKGGPFGIAAGFLKARCFSVI